MEVVQTARAISHHQQTNIQFFTGRMPFLSPNKRCQSTEGTVLHILHRINKILSTSDFFQWAPCTSTRGHSFKLYKKSCSVRVRSTFFSERVVNVWNGLPASVDFSSLRSFTRTVKLADLSIFLKCYN